MTSIAWDGKRLAADGRATIGNRVGTNDFVKIHKSKGVVRGSPVVCYALAGRADMYSLIGEWIDAGCPPTEDFEEKEFEAIIITKDAVLVYSEGSYDLLELPEGDPVALGSGTDFIYSAIAFGKNAIEAVQHAASIDIFSGGNGLYIDCRCDKPELKGFKV